MNRNLLRSFVVLAIWIPCAGWLFSYSQKETQGHRFESHVLSNGRVSSVQREFIFKGARSTVPGDVILQVKGVPFDYKQIKKLVNNTEVGSYLVTKIYRKDEVLTSDILVRSYSKRDLLVLLLLPILVSLSFLAFSLITPLQRFDSRKSREAVDVFSLLCFGFSLFFLFFFPSITMGLKYPSSIGLPILAVMILHLFLVYPKKKAVKPLRIGILIACYSAAAALIGLRIYSWNKITPLWFGLLDISILGVCVISAMASLGNTLFTSRDFWARRRARLLSLIFAIGFVGSVSAFISFLWEGPRFSLERILAISLLFPVAFAFVFSKENVFDLERIFKRGIHQFLFLGIATTFAVVLGFGWHGWAELRSEDWLLWVAIAMVVTLFARPIGVFAERQMYRWTHTSVRFPPVDEIFQTSESLDEFLQRFCEHAVTHLNMNGVVLGFLKDPTRVWTSENEQKWKYSKGRLYRIYDKRKQKGVHSRLKRGGLDIGKIIFTGGDSLAFDPLHSYEWDRVCQSLASCLELLVLRDFLETQQGLLAVGRMQALLAHEMKNPLAVINICAGLMQEHIVASDEAEELLRTIQSEVTRISDGIQKVFNHTGAHQKHEVVDTFYIVESIKESLQTRFPEMKLDINFYSSKEKRRWGPEVLRLRVEREGFRQSIQNLLTNAFEAGSTEAELRISLFPKESLQIAVKDNGPGIPKGVELFRPFVTTKPNGTGLGLSHVKAFVDRHSGQIRVRTRKTLGTTFVMEFSAEIVVKTEENQEDIPVAKLRLEKA